MHGVVCETFTKVSVIISILQNSLNVILKVWTEGEFPNPLDKITFDGRLLPTWCQRCHQGLRLVGLRWEHQVEGSMFQAIYLEAKLLMPMKYYLWFWRKALNLSLKKTNQCWFPIIFPWEIMRLYPVRQQIPSNCSFQKLCHNFHIFDKLLNSNWMIECMKKKKNRITNLPNTISDFFMLLNFRQVNIRKPHLLLKCD